MYKFCFNKSNGDITFMNTQNLKKHVISLLDYNDYRRVSPITLL